MKRFLFILMTAVFVMGSTVTAFAMDYPSELPALPENYRSQIVIAKVNNTEDTYLFIAELPEGASLTLAQVAESKTVSGRRLNLIAHDNVKLYTYSLRGGVWQHVGTDNYTPGTQVMLNAQSFQYLYSTLNVTDLDTGEVLFPQPPVPLAEEIREIAEGTLTVETMPELTRTVLVVALCGVGCLALAISLPLLKKVFSRFLV